MVQGTLNYCLSFSNLLMAYLLSNSEFGSIASTSKVATKQTPMVVTIVVNITKCKLWAALRTPPCNPPHLPPCVFIISSSVFSSWKSSSLGFFYLLPYVPPTFESSQIRGPPKGRIHLAMPMLFFLFVFQLVKCYFHSLFHWNFSP